MAEETVLLRVGIDPDQINNSIKAIGESRKQMQALIETNKELAKAEGNTSEAYIKNEAEIRKLNASISTNQRVLTANQKLIESTSGSIVEMRERVKILNDQYINLSKTARNSEFGKKLQQEIKGTTDELKKLEAEIGNFQRDVGNYRDSFNSLASSIDAGGVPIAGLTSKLTSFINPLTAASAGVVSLIGSYSKSAVGAEDFARAQGLLNASLDQFVNKIGNASSGRVAQNWARFLSDALIAFTSATKAEQDARKTSVELARIELQTLRELEVDRIKAEKVRKDTEREAENARRIRDDSEKSFQERLDAVKVVQEELKENEVARVAVLNRQLNALLSYGEAVGTVVEGTQEQFRLTGQINFENVKDLNLKILGNQLLAERADIQEEINGKLTENVSAERAITAEILKQAQERAKAIRDSIEQGNAAVAAEGQETTLAEGVSPNGIFGTGLYGIKPDQLSKIINDSNKALSDGLKKQNDDEFFALEESRKAREDYAEAILEFNRQINQSNLDLTGNAITALGDLNEAAKGNAEITKILRIAETTVSTYSAAQAAYASQLTLPTPDAPVRAGIAAATAVISGLARVAAIAAVKIGGAAQQAPKPVQGRRILEDGGEINIGGNLHSAGGTVFQGSDGTTFEAERGEKMFVVNRNSSALLDALKTVNDFGVRNRKAVGRNYFADGGFVARNSAQAVSSSIQSENLRQAINQFSNLKVIARITDINRVQSDINENVAIATL